MAKSVITRHAGKKALRPAARKIGRKADNGAFVAVRKARLDAGMKAAQHSGLLGEKSHRIGGRISPALVEQARRQTE